MRRKVKRENSKQKQTKHKVLIIMLILIILAVVVFICLKSCEDEFSLSKPSPTPIYLEDEGGSQEGEAETVDREKILEELEKQQLVVTDKLSSNITFPSGEVNSIGEWIVENPEENTIIMQAEVYLEDTLIAKSTPIYPNQHITAVSLLSEIEAGGYEVIAYLNYYDLETKEFVSKAGYRIHLTVN